MFKIKENLQIIAIICAIITLPINLYIAFFETPNIIEQEFIKKWDLNRIIYDTISNNKYMTSEQIYKEIMKFRPKSRVDKIQSDISFSLANLTQYKMIERNEKGQYSITPSSRELISLYGNLISDLSEKKDVLEKVKKISFSNCYKYTVKDIYEKIKNEINMDYEYFRMLVYSNIKMPNTLPYIYDGYIINSDDKVCHLASARYNK